MTTLPSELMQALDDNAGRPIEVVHPETKAVYLLIARDQYERACTLWEGEPFSEDEQRQLLRDAGQRAGWTEPPRTPTTATTIIVPLSRSRSRRCNGAYTGPLRVAGFMNTNSIGSGVRAL